MRFDVRLPKIRKSEMTSRRAGALVGMCGAAKVLNMKAAKALGISFPASVLLRADKLIE
jgi:ABC-type uncharacterized transport system substrate-binding protein